MKPIASFCLLVSLALAAGASAAPVDRAASVALRSYDIDVREPVTVPSGLAADATVALTPGGAGGELALVKYPRPVGAAERAALAAEVERVLIYLPHDAFLVRVPRGTAQALAPAGASWVGPYHPAYKISPEAAALAADPAAREEDRAVPVLLHLDPDTDLAAAAAALDGLGAGRVVGTAARERLSRVRLLMTPAELAGSLETLARFHEVVWIELEGRRVLLNDTTAWVGQSGTSGGQATPIHDAGLRGQGQVLAVLDTGLDADMCYFSDPAEGLPARNECNGGTAVNPDHRKVLAVDFLWSNECNGGISNFEWDTQGHGSHVAGTAAGDQGTPGVRDGGDGMAPAAKLVIQDGGFAVDNCADLPGLGCPVVDLVPLFQQAYDQGARFHSNSWGDRENFEPHNIYSAGSEDADEFMWNHRDFLLVFAAGNEGAPDSVLSPSTAKNVVAVGSTQRGANAESLSSFSSCGFTDDDRIKPDLTMPGSSILSANDDGSVLTNNCSITSSSGTSMAAPGAAGFGMLVRQYYEDGFYPSGAAVPADAFAPSAALVKATMLNSTHQMANVSPIPSTCQGWGRLQLDRSLYLGAGDRRLWVEDDDTGFAGPGSLEFFFEAGGAAEPLRATLTWTDFPSTPAAATHLVNDLDLAVTGPGGVLLGNVFSAGVSIPGGTPDRRDTVEQVLIPAAAPAGPYRVVVSAFAIPQGPQPFALVLSGDMTPVIFADGWESGDTSVWSSTTP